MPVHRSSSTGGHTLYVCRIQTTFKGVGKKVKRRQQFKIELLIKNRELRFIIIIIIICHLYVLCNYFLFLFLAMLPVLPLRILS